MPPKRALPIIDYTRHPAYRHREVSPEAQAIVVRFEKLVDEKRDTLLANLPLFNARRQTHHDPLINELASSGAAAFRIPGRHIAKLLQETEALNRMLSANISGKRRVRLRFKDTQIVIHSDDRPTPGCEGLINCLLAAISDAGALEVAEEYFSGAKAVLGRTVFRINVPNQPFYSNLFPDAATVHPQTTGMHIDANGRPALNGVIYLSEVGPEQGPFRNVSGSNHWAFDIEDRAVRKSMDDRVIRAETEKHFMAFPAHLRRKANFGHDIIDGSAVATELLQRERAYHSDECNMVLFDSDAVHRGGGVTEGRRVSMIFQLRMVVP
ncbi:hypothetical protein KXS15_16860 [Sinorhizobium meliloti]|uniref:hypothetical protein n=1 Tax=Rhizobium meliloti TaxID=382 RepID=UPI003F18EB30